MNKPSMRFTTQRNSKNNKVFLEKQLTNIRGADILINVAAVPFGTSECK